MEIRLLVDGRDVGVLPLAGVESWDELAVELPRDLRAGVHRIELVPPAGKSFSALHYWSFPSPGGEASRARD
jgi:hypothetical protein